MERAIAYEELLDADELFGTGNYAKVSPCTRIEVRELHPGPIYTRARELYFEFAQDCGKPFRRIDPLWQARDLEGLSSHPGRRAR